MTRKTLLKAVALAVAAAAVAIVVDLLTVSDEELLEEFAAAVTGEVREDRIESALARYVDLSQVPLKVVALRRDLTFGQSDQSELRGFVQNALSPFIGEQTRRMGTAITIDGDGAVVTIRALTSSGFVDLRFALDKRQDAWLVRRLDLSTSRMPTGLNPHE